VDRLLSAVVVRRHAQEHDAITYFQLQFLINHNQAFSQDLKSGHPKCATAVLGLRK